MKKIFSSDLVKSLKRLQQQCSTLVIRRTFKETETGKKKKTRKKKSDKKFLHHQARANNIFLLSYEFIIRKNEMWGLEGDKVEAGRRARSSLFTSQIPISSPLSRKWNFNQSNEKSRLPVYVSLSRDFISLLTTISQWSKLNPMDSNPLESASTQAKWKMFSNFKASACFHRYRKKCFSLLSSSRC